MEVFNTYFEIPCKEVIAVYVPFDYIQECHFYLVLIKTENYYIFCLC